MTVTQEQFSSVKEDIRTLSVMISDIHQTVTDHTYRLSLIGTRLDNWNIRLDNVEGRLDGLQGSANEILTLIRKGS
jgi:hypothetical protein